MKILIICTGNSCRSQMAEGFLKSLDPRLKVFSAGTRPEKEVHPNAIRVMQEIGIDISANHPKNMDHFSGHSFDYVITVCDDAKEQCAYFSGKADHRLHIGFEDPAKARGTDEQILRTYRKVRDQIRNEFESFYRNLKS